MARQKITEATAAIITTIIINIIEIMTTGLATVTAINLVIVTITNPAIFTATDVATVIAHIETDATTAGNYKIYISKI